MKIPIYINIKTKASENNPFTITNKKTNTETIEKTALGTMIKTKKGIKLEYIEELDDGPFGIHTTVSLLPGNMISVNRLGLSNSHMVFEKGKTHNCILNSGLYPIEFRVQTNELQNGITQMGGKLDIDYTVEVIGSRTENNHITLSVAPHESVITS